MRGSPSPFAIAVRIAGAVARPRRGMKAIMRSAVVISRTRYFDFLGMVGDWWSIATQQELHLFLCAGQAQPCEGGSTTHERGRSRKGRGSLWRERSGLLSLVGGIEGLQECRCRSGCGYFRSCDGGSDARSAFVYVVLGMSGNPV